MGEKLSGDPVGKENLQERVQEGVLGNEEVQTENGDGAVPTGVREGLREREHQSGDARALQVCGVCKGSKILQATLHCRHEEE